MTETQLMGATEAAEALGVKGPNLASPMTGIPSAKLASGTVWLAAHVMIVKGCRDRGELDQAPARVKRSGLRLPKVAGAKEASEILGVTPTYVRKIDGMPEPQELAMGPVWLVSDVKRIARERGRERRPSCPRHGRRDMRTSANGKTTWCGICNREHARARRAALREQKEEAKG